MTSVGTKLDIALRNDARAFAAIERGEDPVKRRENVLALIDALDEALMSVPPRRSALLCQMLALRARRRCTEANHAHG